MAVPFAYSDGAQSDAVIKERAVASLPELGFEAGMALSSSFKTQWKHEQYSVVYFDTAQWMKALEYADRYEWKMAMDIWLELLDTHDLMKRACAEFDIAVACYMLGDYRLAELWLDRSDADSRISLFSDGLRKRLELRKK